MRQGALKSRDLKNSNEFRLDESSSFGLRGRSLELEPWLGRAELRRCKPIGAEPGCGFVQHTRHDVAVPGDGGTCGLNKTALSGHLRIVVRIDAATPCPESC